MPHEPPHVLHGISSYGCWWPTRRPSWWHTPNGLSICSWMRPNGAMVPCCWGQKMNGTMFNTRGQKESLESARDPQHIGGKDMPADGFQHNTMSSTTGPHNERLCLGTGRPMVEERYEASQSWVLRATPTRTKPIPFRCPDPVSPSQSFPPFSSYNKPLNTSCIPPLLPGVSKKLFTKK